MNGNQRIFFGGQIKGQQIMWNLYTNKILGTIKGKSSSISDFTTF
jgi:hypothetical protein